MHEAFFYIKLENQTVKCELCPWFCVLKSGETGNCGVRTNFQGELFSRVYNQIASLGIDPVEKKPFYHFHPGKTILSIGEVGCNLHCSFCQNHRISQCHASGFSGFYPIHSGQIVEKALNTPGNIGIAFTYNEPFTFFEFMFETARQSKASGIKNVVVSNGYVNPKPLEEIIPYVDAFNIDLKAFSEAFYRKHTKGKLKPVLETLKIISENRAHLEITNLVIPGLNDDIREFENMINWIASELGVDVPLHLSRYFPHFRLNLPPTSVEKMEVMFEVARQRLNFVYLGNVNDESRSSTFCPDCGSLLISRNHYQTKIIGLKPDNACEKCGKQIKIVT